jgi:hypothetical protein
MRSKMPEEKKNPPPPPQKKQPPPEKPPAKKSDYIGDSVPTRVQPTQEWPRPDRKK